MKARRKWPFRVERFLVTVNGGKAIAPYRKNQKIFAQGDPADSVFLPPEGQGQGQGLRPMCRLRYADVAGNKFVWLGDDEPTLL